MPDSAEDGEVKEVVGTKTAAELIAELKDVESLSEADRQTREAEIAERRQKIADANYRINELQRISPYEDKKRELRTEIAQRVAEGDETIDKYLRLAIACCGSVSDALAVAERLEELNGYLETHAGEPVMYLNQDKVSLGTISGEVLQLEQGSFAHRVGIPTLSQINIWLDVTKGNRIKDGKDPLLKVDVSAAAWERKTPEDLAEAIKYRESILMFSTAQINECVLRLLSLEEAASSGYRGSLDSQTFCLWAIAQELELDLPALMSLPEELVNDWKKQLYHEAKGVILERIVEGDYRYSNIRYSHIDPSVLKHALRVLPISPEQLQALKEAILSDYIEYHEGAEYVDRAKDLIPVFMKHDLGIE